MQIKVKINKQYNISEMVFNVQKPCIKAMFIKANNSTMAAPMYTFLL
jgi:hypothetical protein